MQDSEIRIEELGSSVEDPKVEEIERENEEKSPSKITGRVSKSKKTSNWVSRKGNI